ncbi:hypothetical protein [Fructobacillus tropaeoli]|uniref:hypothetical protein n=1 Tax=Fructobacillus tropaeoli TaxID=709323 RepID=UPI0019450163|nr:hypothetical protein [Fructobacillus tropaeoli]GIC69585.1 hypothetical protein FT12353_02220 [Fructobacillus tropaeoli]
MIKKFTEKEYQKIVDFFDGLNENQDMGLLNSHVVDEIFTKFISDYDYSLDWQEIVAIINPITRDEAKEKFVEKEKKYYWRYKKTDEDGDEWLLVKTSGIIHLSWVDDSDLLTEREVIEAGYIPDMYEKEEVE